MMKRACAALSLVLVVTGADAQTRPSTVNAPCGVSRELVYSRGAIILGTGGYSYDRYVRDRTFCEFNEYTDPAFVPSLDDPQCFVGYRCKAGPKDWWAN